MTALTLARVFVPWAIRRPHHLRGFARIARAHVHADRIRSAAARRGLRVPPFLVLSVTARCNLTCAGCFALAVGTVSRPTPTGALDMSEWRRIVKQAIKLGVIGFIVAGGEPFLVKGLVDLFQEFDDRIFLVFTNGTALTSRDFDVLPQCSNTVTVVGLEGDARLTDLRRGAGVFAHASGTLDRLSRRGALTGVAATITAVNADYWSQATHIDDAMRPTSGLGFFFEYIPTGDDERLALGDGQRARVREAILEYRRTHNVCVVHSPADEELIGGCVSAGRGFAHVTPGGDVTPCPVSMVSTHNVRRSTLEAALASPLFTRIRRDAHLLETEGHPCALVAHRAKLDAIVGELHGAGARQ
jgi:MoaA/NifB/PqqE/SkfB family radical SAM enzyme